MLINLCEMKTRNCFNILEKAALIVLRSVVGSYNIPWRHNILTEIQHKFHYSVLKLTDTMNTIASKLIYDESRKRVFYICRANTDLRWNVSFFEWFIICLLLDRLELEVIFKNIDSDSFTEIHLSGHFSRESHNGSLLSQVHCYKNDVHLQLN